MIQPEILCLIMFITTCALLLIGFPVAFTLAGSAMIFALFATIIGIFDISFLVAFPQRIFSVMSNEVLVAVPLFIFMGVMLEKSKVAEELLDNMGRAFGKIPGGLAYSVSVVGMLMAASTGIVGATVISMGLISLPVMLKRKYDPAFSCGSIAAAGTLGQIIPPSIVLVLLGDQLSVAYQNAQFEQGIFAPDTVSVNDLFAGALIPGIMLVAMYLIYQRTVTFLKPNTAPAIPSHENQKTNAQFYKSLITVLIPPLALIIAVLGSILTGLASPTEAASVGAVGAIMLAAYKMKPDKKYVIVLSVIAFALLLTIALIADLRIQKQTFSTYEAIAFSIATICAIVMAVGIVLALKYIYLNKQKSHISVLSDVMRTTMTISSMVFIIIVGAAMFSLVFRGLNGDEYIENFLQQLPGGTITAIMLVMAVMFIMGFFLDFLEIIFIVVPIVAPILLQMEIAPGETMNPVWLGVMMGINLQTSFLTPPFGFALFYLRGVAPDVVRTVQIYKGVMPFVAIQMIALIILWVFPNIATWLPLALYGP